MSDPPEPTQSPSEGRGERRPNSGLREGEIPHAEVNAALSQADKIIAFGQQTRLRDGVLTNDEEVPRYHAGHDIVKFLYSGIRQIPDHILGAILDQGISVTLVKKTRLLVFHHAREHQSLHIGRTRKTIYMPEMVLQAAFNKGYDYWAIAQVVIGEAWPLLDFLLLVELIRRCQQRLNTKYSLGYSFIKDTLGAVSKHRRENEEDAENDFALFYRHYCEHFYTWNRDIRDRDPYELADEIFDERQERVWANLKIDAITHAYDYPTYFDLDRDIVHPTALSLAEASGLPVDPQRAEDVLHDLGDVARFKVGRQIKTDQLLDLLLPFGAPGIRRFVDAVASERAMDQPLLTENQYDSYDVIAAFKRKLQSQSSSPIEGIPGSICNDFNDLLSERTLHHVREAFGRLMRLPKADQEDAARYLQTLVYRLLGLCRPELTEPERQSMVYLPSHFTPPQQVKALTEAARPLLETGTASREDEFIAAILEKLNRHDLYHTVFCEQAAKLLGRPVGPADGDQRASLAELFGLIPDKPYRLSSDPHAVRSRLDQFERLRRDKPDDDGLFVLIVGILVRLDLADNYRYLLDRIPAVPSEISEPALSEVTDSIGGHDHRRARIRQAAERLLEGLGDPSFTPADRISDEDLQDALDSAIVLAFSGRDEREGIPSPEETIRTFYRLTGQDLSPGQLARDQALYKGWLEEGYSDMDILYATEWILRKVPDARKFSLVYSKIQPE